MEKKTTNIILQILLIGIFAFIALGSATSYNGYQTKSQLENLLGKPIAAALQQFGPQSYVSDDGQGGKIYTWENNAGTTAKEKTDRGWGNNSKWETSSNYCKKYIYVNSGGTIYYWRWEGNHCE